MSSNVLAMKQLVRYCILLFGALVFLISACSVGSQHLVLKKQVACSGEISQSPFSINEHCVPDLVVDLSHCASDVKFCIRKNNYGREAEDDMHSSFQNIAHWGCTFSLFGPTDYYVFGLRKIIV